MKILESIRKWFTPPPQLSEAEMWAKTVDAGRQICEAMDRADLPRVCSYKFDCRCRACTVRRWSMRP
jgi:hypothetical protein